MVREDRDLVQCNLQTVFFFKPLVIIPVLLLSNVLFSFFTISEILVLVAFFFTPVKLNLRYLVIMHIPNSYRDFVGSLLFELSI